jgi:hypothetical protein
MVWWWWCGAVSFWCENVLLAKFRQNSTDTLEISFCDRRLWSAFNENVFHTTRD